MESKNPNKKERWSNDNSSFNFPDIENSKQSEKIEIPENTNSITIDIGEEEEEEDKNEKKEDKTEKAAPNDTFTFPEFPAVGGESANDPFQFSFDDFTPDQENDQSAFVFDANDTKPTNQEDELFQKFVSLLSNPCFEYTGKPLTELFKQEDETESIDAAYDIIMKSC